MLFLAFMMALCVLRSGFAHTFARQSYKGRRIASNKNGFLLKQWALMASAADMGGDNSGDGQKKKVIRIKKPTKEKKRSITRKNKPLPSHNRDGFVTIQLGTDEDVQSAEMEERMQDARGWVSKKLSDDDARILNRAMGIEAEVLAALAAEEDNMVGKESSRKAGFLTSTQAASKKG